MNYRLCTGAITLALAGCFSEPPRAGGGADGSASEGTTTGDAMPATTGSTSTPVPESSSGSSGDDPDGSTGSSGAYPDCNFDYPVETGRVPADVVVIVGEQAELPVGFLDNFGEMTHLAVIAPETTAVDLAEDVPIECRNGCAQDCEPPRRVLLPYATQAGNEAFSLFLGDDFTCVFRPPPRNEPLSQPSRHLWLFTETPGMSIPGEIQTRTVELGFRLHVACPGCTRDSLDSQSDLAQLVEATQGSVADSDGDLTTQGLLIAAPRASCVWPEPDAPADYQIENEYSVDRAPYFAADGALSGFSQCEEEFDEGDEKVVFPMFFKNDEGNVELCPIACRLAQLSSADDTDVYRCQ